jgi:VCBS repeat-containing protein
VHTRYALASVAGGALLAALIATPAYAAPSNTPPVANDDSYSTAANTTLSIGAPGILANDLDPDGDAFSAQLLNGAQHGTVSLSPNGSFNYVPNQNYTGPDQFTYQICENFTVLREQQLPGVNEGCDGATVRINVNGTTTTTPVPPPVGGGIVTYQTCAAAFRAGVHDIPRGDPRYRTYLDRDGDGIACELNGNDTVTIVRPPTTTIVQQPPKTVVVQPPATVTQPCNCPTQQPAQIVQQPVIVPPAQIFTSPMAPSVGAVSTGDGSVFGNK